jgi:hypothetical protein
MNTRFRCTSLPLAVVCVIAAGCGSSMFGPDGSAGSSGAAGSTGFGGAGGSTQSCGDPNLAIDPTAVIDDMEAGGSASLLGNGSGWWAGGDEASKAMGASINPDGVVASELIPGGRCGSKRAIHVTGQGFGLWAVVNVSMGWGTVDGGGTALLPRDVSFRTGVTFWARVGDTSSNQVRLQLSDQYSNDMGNICDPTQTSGPTACFDHFFTALTGLGTTWKQYKIPFGGLKQMNFGLPRDALDTAHLYSIDFSFPTGAVFDFWVDDIAWY